MDEQSIQHIIRMDGEAVFIEPICDFFEIDYKKKYLKIKNEAFFLSRVTLAIFTSNFLLKADCMLKVIPRLYLLLFRQANCQCD